MFDNYKPAILEVLKLYNISKKQINVQPSQIIVDYYSIELFEELEAISFNLNIFRNNKQIIVTLK